MTRDDIITLPNPHLREKSAKVQGIDQKVSTLLGDMEAALLDWEAHRPHELGVALAAVQVDKLVRAVVVRNNFEDKTDSSFFALINPEIIKLEGTVVTDHEGCLSVKDVYGLVPRYSKVRIRALDKDGREIRFKAHGFLARVLQHEIDHTNGIMFIDHIKDQDAFFKLDKQGELIKVDYETISKSRILW